MKYVRIVWRDATSVDAWTPREEIRIECMEIVTVGILFGENKDAVTVALSGYNDESTFSNYISIPKTWIVSRETLSSRRRKKI